MLSSPNAGLQNPMSSVGVGQPSAPSVNTSTPIDPSSMQRAYAALGLPYGSQATGPAQTQQAPGPGPTAGAQNTQQQLPQQMRPINALGNVCFPPWCLVFCEAPANCCLFKKKTVLYSFKLNLHI